jgi:hypothetical protein
MQNVKPQKLSVNVSGELITQIDSLVKRNGPFARRHAIHLAALRIGLSELTAHPERLLEALGKTNSITGLNLNP